jgi:membrane protease YdiL (CAAX protease family)
LKEAKRSRLHLSAARVDVPWGWKELVAIIVWTLVPANILAVLIMWATGYIDLNSETLITGGRDGGNLYTLYYDLLTLVGVFAILARKKNLLKNLGFRRFPIKQSVLAVIVIFALIYMVGYALDYLVNQFVQDYDSSSELGPNHATWPSWLLATAVAVGIAPFFEEILFRAVAFPVLARRFGILTGAIIVSLIFGIGHWSLVGTPLTFIVGIILCYMYVHFRSIVPGIVLHMVNNFITMLFVIPK